MKCKLTVGALIRRKYFGHAHKARMSSFDPSFNPNQLYIITKLDHDAGILQIMDPSTGKIETLPDSTDYFEVLSQK